jgi:hypothetical protein
VLDDEDSAHALHHAVLVLILLDERVRATKKIIFNENINGGHEQS